MLRKKIKASAIQNLTDARYFAAWEVEWLSFNLEEGTEAYIAPGTMKAIREWVDGVKIVGEFSTKEEAIIAEWAKLLELEWLQIPSGLSVSQLIALQEYKLIQELKIDANTKFENLLAQLETAEAKVACFQLNFEEAGIAWETLETQTHLQREQLKTLCERFSIILSIAFQPEKLEELTTYLPEIALNLQGGEEEKVGFKSFDDMDAILEQLEVDG